MATDPILERLTRGKLRLLVEGDGGQLRLASDRPGLGPLRDAVFAHPGLLDGADVAMPAVGVAAALLLIHAKAGRVHARVLSHDARKALDAEGIEHQAEQVQKKLPEEHLAELEPLEGRAREALTPLAFVEELRRQAE
ncbi:MAG: DUF1893 domain-containing protein [Planctomycetes bacterium]|nr:DUF1893 domain-containing protein [Planctomycetota bacterium]